MALSEKKKLREIKYTMLIDVDRWIKQLKLIIQQS